MQKKINVCIRGGSTVQARLPISITVSDVAVLTSGQSQTGQMCANVKYALGMRTLSDGQAGTRVCSYALIP